MGLGDPEPYAWPAILAATAAHTEPFTFEDRANEKAQGSGHQTNLTPRRCVQTASPRRRGGGDEPE